MKDILTRYDVHSLPPKVFYMNEFIHDNESMIYIKLCSNDDSAIYVITFKETLAYRYICAGNSAMPRKSIDTWPLYTVESSGYLEWFHSVSYDIRKHNKIVHFSIITPNGVMDILSLDAPELLYGNMKSNFLMRKVITSQILGLIHICDARRKEMGFNSFEATLITFCEALWVEISGDKKRIIAQTKASDEFSVGYYGAMRHILIFLEQQTAEHGLSLEDVGIDKAELDKFVFSTTLEDQKRVKNQSVSSDSFHNGYTEGLCRVLSLLEQQAELYGLSLENIALDKIKP